MEQEQAIVKGGVDILIKPLGPIVITSKSFIYKPDGTVDVKEKVSLCGCGMSKNKPYCDASHKQLIKENE